MVVDGSLSDVESDKCVGKYINLSRRRLSIDASRDESILETLSKLFIDS